MSSKITAAKIAHPAVFPLLRKFRLPTARICEYQSLQTLT